MLWHGFGYRFGYMPTDTNAMTPQQFKVYENRLRRMAARQGLQLVKWRTRDPRAYTFGAYMLVDPNAHNVISHGQRLSAQDVEDILTGEREAEQTA